MSHGERGSALPRVRAVRSSRFVRDVATLSGSTSAGQAIVALATPLLTRLYTPAEFGAYGTFISVVSVGSILVTLRLESALPGVRDDAEAASLLVATLAVVFPMSLLASLAIGALVWGDVMGLGRIGWQGIALTLPALLGFGLTSALRYWHVRRQQFRSLGLVSIAQGASRAFVPVLLSAGGVGWLGLGCAEVVGRWIGFGTMARAARTELRQAVAHGWAARSVVAARAQRRLVSTMLPSSIADALILSLAVPLLGASFGAAAAGIFALVQRVVALPASLVGASVADVFHAQAAERVTEGPQALRVNVLRVAGHLLRVGFALLLPAAVLAPLLAGPVLGSGWRDAGIALALMTPQALANLVVVPVSRALLVARRPELKLVYDGLALTLLFGSVYLAHRMQMSFLGAVAMLSASQCIAYVAYFILILRAVGTARPEEH